MRRRKRENGASGYLFPIGLGLGALVALALFLGFGIGPFGGSRDTADTPIASGDLPDAKAEDTVPTVSLDDARPLPAEAAATAPVSPSEEGAEEWTPSEELDALANPTGDGTGDVATTGGPPSVDDPEAVDLFGGRVAMVSSAVPRVVVLADGTSLVPGERLPGGQRIIGIERDRILLEHEGAEWQVRVP